MGDIFTKEFLPEEPFFYNSSRFYGPGITYKYLADNK